MAQQHPMPGNRSQDQDAWGTVTREGYEDRRPYEPRKSASQRQGSRPLRNFGSLLVVGGILWITYVATSPNGITALLHPGLPARPILVLAIGLLVLLLAKLIR